MEESSKDIFLIFKPKDIVSGDFYYSVSHQSPKYPNELFYICAADCTGHGVPGALMSMMAISKLNEAILERNLTFPSDILNDVRSGIIQSLNQEGNSEETKDGMDCTLCCFDFKTSQMFYACANNPIWLIRNNSLLELNGDKMPVGKSPKENILFKHYTIDLYKNDIIYLFTDGYADQFGGPDGKKFKSKKLKELLMQINSLSLESQKKNIEERFESWRGPNEQVDDVCLIGIKI